MEDRDQKSVVDVTDETREDSPEDRALQNHLVLNNIFHRLTFTDLKTCRIVNQLWNFISSEIILDRDCCEVQLMYDVEYCKLLRISEAVIGHKEKTNDSRDGLDLAELNRVLNNSINFPCMNFYFNTPKANFFPRCEQRCEVISESLKLSDFLEVHANKIRTLTISLVFSPTVLTKVPNVENLNLRAYIESYNCPEISKSGIGIKTWPKLRILTWERFCFIVPQILERAPNLIAVRTRFIEHDLGKIINCGKGYAVKKLECCLTTPDFTKFVQAIPQLEELVFKGLTEYTQRHFLNNVKTLLEGCSHSLRHVNFSETNVTHEIVIPKLPKVTKLAVGINFRKTCFPYGTNLLETFPDLNILDLSSLRRAKRKRGNLQTCFPPPPALIGNLSTVKILKISIDISSRWMRRIHSNICPNFNELVINANKGEKVTQQLPSTLKKVFTVWRHLVDIKIKHVDFGACDLDPIFAGSGVFEGPDGPDTSMTISCVDPVKSSLISMERLKYLTFEFNQQPSTLRNVMEKPFLFSQVSCLRGFAIIPKLQVSILWDKECEMLNGMQAHLKSVTPFVKFLRKTRLEY